MKHSFDFIDPLRKGLKDPLGVWEFRLENHSSKETQE